MYAQSFREISNTFWKSFGQYMATVPGACGEHVHWINYSTGVKSVRFGLDLSPGMATVALITDDPNIWERLSALRRVFTDLTGNDWVWEKDRIVAQLGGKDVRRREDWPELISFFKHHLMALDVFWESVREGFE